MRKQLRTVVGAALALLIGLVGLGTLTASPANAVPIPSFFTSSGWWNQPNPNHIGGQGVDDSYWMYDDFPIACNTGSDNFWKVFYAYPDNETDNSNTTQIRRGVAAAASTFAASAHEVLGSNGVWLQGSHSPRFATFQTSSGDCYPTITRVSIPASYFSYDNGVANWMRNNGYLQTGRKNIVLIQHMTWSNPAWGGVAYPSGDGSPGAGNANNYGGDDLYVDLTGTGTGDNAWRWWARTLSHEMTHLLGAVESNAPHYNTQNPWHPYDCWDVLCYGLTGIGEIRAYCPGESQNYPLESHLFFRQDCNGDDYYNVNNPSWESSRWNEADSSFLWVNPQPTGPAPKVTRVRVPNHVDPPEVRR